MLLAATAAAHGSAPLELEWCAGSMPATWGFAVTPSEACQRVHVQARSAAVLVLSAKVGPGAPEGWTVEVLTEREVMASGPAPLQVGQRLETFLLLETNRSTGSMDSRGALPVEWSTWFADASGAVTASGKMTASFPPVMPLADAASRGMVLLTLEPLGPAGPVEVTVDNPTWYPVWLDLPTGTLISADGQDWVVASASPFRMMRRQKTGRTITAFPLLPTVSAATPRRLALGRSTPGEAAARARDLATAADRLVDATRTGARQPAGRFERASPFDFWPLALRWATWTATGTPPADLLGLHVAQIIGERAAAGDPGVQGLEASAAAAEVASAASDIAAEADLLRSGALPMELQAARERFR